MRSEARAVSAEVLDHGPGGTHSARLERDVRVLLTERRLADLRVGESGLVFGRIDRVDGDRHYIGRVAIADVDNEPLVVDWRAPAAEPFYRATARQPLGLARRRHFILRGRRLAGIDDEPLGDEAGHDGLILMGEGALLAALESGRTGRMSDIVATIQREQDEIIRAPLAGIVVVQGGPGTGKTAVALHRAAYLLYTHRFPLDRAGVLLVGPNPLFLRYVEQVLPALGEHTVTLATAGTLVPTPVRGGDDQPTTRVKGDARMALVLAKAIRDRERGIPQAAVFTYHDDRMTLTPRASRGIAERVRRQSGTHNARRRSAERLVLAHLRRQAAVEAEEREAFDETVTRSRTFVEVMERMWPALSPEELLHDLFGSPALLRLAAAGVLAEPEWNLLYRPRSPRVADVAWTEADAALLDEVAVHIGPPRRRTVAAGNGDAARWERERVVAGIEGLDPLMRRDVLRHLEELEEGPIEAEAPDPWSRTFGHVLVDEAQDLSPMQLRMLARRCPSGSMTVLGDLGQASSQWSPATWDDVLAHLPSRRSPTRVELTVNYRTPAEVMDIAGRVLASSAAGVAPSRAARRSGAMPVFTSAPPDGLAEVVGAVVGRERAEVGDGKVGVIAPAAVLDAVAAVLPAGARGPDVLDAPVALLAIGQAKGLEFDSVVVVEPAAIVAETAGGTERGRGLRALYTAITRTTRRLHVVHAEPLPPELVPE
ncbi:MAG: AAA family ATPase [Actinomycetota bacterium]|nr:AAA family ATPase [Actinomycetota bacterium]